MFSLFLPFFCFQTVRLFRVKLLNSLQDILSLGLYGSSLIFIVGKFEFLPASGNLYNVANYFAIVGPSFHTG